MAPDLAGRQMNHSDAAAGFGALLAEVSSSLSPENNWSRAFDSPTIA